MYNVPLHAVQQLRYIVFLERTKPVAVTFLYAYSVRELTTMLYTNTIHNNIKRVITIPNLFFFFFLFHSGAGFLATTNTTIPSRSRRFRSGEIVWKMSNPRSFTRTASPPWPHGCNHHRSMYDAIMYAIAEIVIRFFFTRALQ